MKRQNLTHFLAVHIKSGAVTVPLHSLSITAVAQASEPVGVWPISPWRLADYADVLGIAGFFVTIIASILTVWQSRRSQSAAERAEAAAKAAKTNLLRLDSVQEISIAITALDGIRKGHMSGIWSDLPGRYSAVRRQIIGVRAGHASLSERDQTALQGAVTQLVSLEKKVEEYLGAKEPTPLDVAKLNNLVSSIADNLTELLARIKTSGD